MNDIWYFVWKYGFWKSGYFVSDSGNMIFVLSFENLITYNWLIGSESSILYICHILFLLGFNFGPKLWSPTLFGLGSIPTEPTMDFGIPNSTVPKKMVRFWFQVFTTSQIWYGIGLISKFMVSSVGIGPKLNSVEIHSFGPKLKPNRNKNVANM